MGKKSWEKKDRIKVSDQRLLENIDRDLITLDVLSGAFDNGTPTVATTMATVIINILEVKNRVASEQRGKLVFPTPPNDAHRENMLATHRLITMVMSGGKPIELKFEPWFRSGSDPKLQPFRIWWETEPIYVAGISKPGIPLGVIALDPQEQVSWDDREKLTRHQLCTDIRNTMGAHQEGQITATLEDVYDYRSFGAFTQIEDETGLQLTVENGGVVVTVSPAEAAVRQIAEELLWAYGHRPHGHKPVG